MSKGSLNLLLGLLLVISLFKNYSYHTELKQEKTGVIEESQKADSLGQDLVRLRLFSTKQVQRQKDLVKQVQERAEAEKGKMESLESQIQLAENSPQDSSLHDVTRKLKEQEMAVQQVEVRLTQAMAAQAQQKLEFQAQRDAIRAPKVTEFGRVKAQYDEQADVVHLLEYDAGKKKNMIEGVDAIKEEQEKLKRETAKLKQLKERYESFEAAIRQLDLSLKEQEDKLIQASQRAIQELEEERRVEKDREQELRINLAQEQQKGAERRKLIDQIASEYADQKERYTQSLKDVQNHTQVLEELVQFTESLKNKQ